MQDPEAGGSAADEARSGVERDEEPVVAVARARCPADALWRALVDERDAWWPEGWAEHLTHLVDAAHRLHAQPPE